MWACTKLFYPCARVEMAGVCVECLLDSGCIVEPSLLRIPKATTFRDLFETSLLPELSSKNNERCSILFDVSVSASGRGMWKMVSIDDNIGLSLSFGYRYVRFKIANDEGEPPAKHAAPERPCAFRELMTSATKRDCLLAPRQALTRKDELFNDVLCHFQPESRQAVYIRTMLCTR